MKYLIILLPISLLANIWVITSENYVGMVTIAKGDYLIVPISHSLATHYGMTNRIICESKECVEDNIARLEKTWRTRGISVIYIKDK